MADFYAKETIKSLRKLRQLKPDLFKGLMDWGEMMIFTGAAYAHSSIAMAVSDEQRKAAAEAHGHEGHNH